MLKILGGVIVGIFIGSVMIDLVKRIRPNLVDGILTQARAVSDRLIDGVREAYDFREDHKSTDTQKDVQRPG